MPLPILDQSTVTTGTLHGKTRLLIGGAAVVLVAVLAVVGFLVFGGSDNTDTKAAASATTFEVQNGVTLQAFATEPTGTSCTISWQLDSATLRSGDVIVLLWKGGVVARDDALANARGNLTTQIDQIVILRDGATIGSWSAQPAGCV